MYLTHLLLVTKDKTITESYCVGLNMCYLDRCSQLLYEHAGTTERFNLWLDDLKANHRQKLNHIVKHGEKAEIVFYSPSDLNEGFKSFAEKVVAKGITKLSELQNFKNVERNLLRGLVFDLNTQSWSIFLYEGGSTSIAMNSLDIPRETQQDLF